MLLALMKKDDSSPKFKDFATGMAFKRDIFPDEMPGVKLNFVASDFPWHSSETFLSVGSIRLKNWRPIWNFGWNFVLRSNTRLPSFWQVLITSLFQRLFFNLLIDTSLPIENYQLWVLTGFVGQVLLFATFYLFFCEMHWELTSRVMI